MVGEARMTKGVSTSAAERGSDDGKIGERKDWQAYQRKRREEQEWQYQDIVGEHKRSTARVILQRRGG